MTVEQFELLHSLLKNKLEKSFLTRPPLPSELRLAIVLHYLAHEDSIDTTAKIFFVGKSTAYEMIRDVSKIIWEVLSPKFLGIKSVEEWQEVAKEYQDTWDFPNCLGAIDGKHVRIVKPPHSGSAFYNYKKYCSFVLMAACDAKYRLTWIDVGDCGGFSDSCVFEATDFGKLLKSGEINIPEPTPLPRSNVVLPYAFIADEGLTLSNFLINPYPRRKVSNNLKKAVFNYRGNFARTIGKAENTNGETRLAQYRQNEVISSENIGLVQNMKKKGKLEIHTTILVIHNLLFLTIFELHAPPLNTLHSSATPKTPTKRTQNQQKREIIL
ncbi:protein ANTAGONIST OF LIKE HETEROCHROMATIN PROTEIN 1-like [Leptopilina heterotoma]|uniref:protein ANTAGONIST OF LIKE HETEROCHROMATIN PROTEIN 1-like n=1 Tax=Leptopilina heterotoma TaxID=63436 RepID=UPI001CAA16AE|nr:protein ANTAGONIST OF LIKE HETEROCHROMATIN PROTEIN 1-like [Leptopilina heterotoma]